MPECWCPRIKVGSQVTESRNWNHCCPKHGLGTEWYESAEQVEKRRQQNERLRDLQAQARAARALHHDGDVLDAMGDIDGQGSDW